MFLRSQRQSSRVPSCCLFYRIGPALQAGAAETQQVTAESYHPTTQKKTEHKQARKSFSDSESLLSASVMLLAPGLTPVSATLGALGVVGPALVWFVQPLLSARTHRRRSFESEDFFWNFGPNG